MKAHFLNQTIGIIGEYVDRVLDHAQNQVGKCEPLSNTYNATVVAVCDQV